jgi:hypothetical protein
VIRRQAETQRLGEQPAESAHDDGGEQSADDGEDADADPVFAQIAKLDVERPREEQEAESSVQE